MRTSTETNAVPTTDAKSAMEVLSLASTSSAKSKYSFRLFFFTALSVLACAGALANVAAAAAPSGEDQYIEQTPTGGGNHTGSSNNFSKTVGSTNGTLTQADVKKAAEKNKKNKDKQNSDDGSTGGTGAVGSGGSGANPSPPASQSVATAAKLGPFSRKTVLALIALMAAIGIGSSALRGRSHSISGSGTPETQL